MVATWLVVVGQSCRYCQYRSLSTLHSAALLPFKGTASTSTKYQRFLHSFSQRRMSLQRARAASAPSAFAWAFVRAHAPLRPCLGIPQSPVCQLRHGNLRKNTGLGNLPVVGFPPESRTPLRLFGFSSFQFPGASDLRESKSTNTN